MFLYRLKNTEAQKTTTTPPKSISNPNNSSVHAIKNSGPAWKGDDRGIRQHSSNEPHDVSIKLDQSLFSQCHSGVQSQYKLVEATFHSSKEVKFHIDEGACWITSITVLKTGEILLVDSANCKLKLFSPDMERLSALKLTEKPSNACLYSSTVALISTEKCIFVVEISLRKHTMILKNTINLGCYIQRVTACQQNVFITTNTCPPEVRKISLSGEAIWNLPNAKGGQRMFTLPDSIISYTEDKRTKVAVLDVKSKLNHKLADTVTIIDGATGEILTSQTLAGLGYHSGLTYDYHTKNVLVSHSKDGVIIEMPCDLSKETIRFTSKSKEIHNADIVSNDLFNNPNELALNHQKNLLIVSNEAYETFHLIQFYILRYENISKKDSEKEQCE